jgi:hypothetical protein
MVLNDLFIILYLFSQAVIKANPRDIIAFSAEYFRNQARIPGDPIPGSELVAKD